MQYTIKKGDTLGRIAERYHVPLSVLLAMNPVITNPDHIFVGQVLILPNMQDLPEEAVFTDPVNAGELVLRAQSVIGSAIRYKLGGGGMYPTDALPSRNGYCDCSGFVCWVLGLSRKTELPFYMKFGGWIYTDAIVSDVESPSGIFEKISTPEPGCIVVYGAGRAIGHVGIVSEVKAGVMKRVIHCSSGNSRNFGTAIQETSPVVFNRADTVWGRFSGVL